MRKFPFALAILSLVAFGANAQKDTLTTEGQFEPFVWPSKPPADCPFVNSKDIVGIAFAGRSLKANAKSSVMTCINYSKMESIYPVLSLDCKC